MPEQVSGYAVSGQGHFEISSVVDRAGAVLRIQEGLGFRSDREATIIRRLMEAQRDLERGKTLPKFLLREDQSIALLSGANAVALPSDFLRRSDTLIQYTPIYSTYPRRVPWKDYDAAYLAYQSYNPGGPQVVSLRESSLWFSPVADRNYTLSWSYYRKAVVLETNVTNLWLQNAPEWLIGEAGLRMAKDTRNPTAIQLFTDMRNTAMSAWLKETVLNEAEDDQPLRMGANS